MALYIVAFPRFAPADAQWIETVREEHDPQFGRLAAHVTLVFAVQDLAVEAAVDHLQAVARQTRRFAVRFDAAALRSGLTDADFYAYLLPSQGADALCGLHDALHGGVLAGQPRLAFEPHVTLGRSSERSAMAALVDSLGNPPPDAEAAVDALTLLRVGAGIETVATAPLA